MKLTVFFDSFCPLCVSEVKQLARLDKKSLLVFEDIHAEDFEHRFPEIDRHKADRVLHGRYEDGKMIYGLDVTAQAWRLVGRHRWLAVLRWPVVRFFADLAYRFFARYRYGISYVLTGERRCISCAKASDKTCSL